MAQDSRGYDEIVLVSHENSFDTFASYTNTAPSQENLVSSVSGYAFKITDFAFNATTATTFTLFNNTTGTKFIYSLAAGESAYFNMQTPIICSTSGGIHFSADGTSASVFISGYYSS